MIETKSSTTNRSRAADCCGDLKCGPGLRNHYFDGKRLTPESFRVEHAYGRAYRLLSNRAIHGWGVVYGYAIKAVPSKQARDAATQLKVASGFALDPCGRELVIPEATALSIGDVMVLDEKGMPAADPQNVLSQAAWRKETCWILSAHYAEYDLDPVNITDSCQCGHRHWDHVCETVRFSLQPVDCGQRFPEPACGLHCGCCNGACCGREVEADVPPSTRRGGCKCLCDDISHKEFPECGRLCEVEGPCCRTFRVALREAVPLACVTIVQDCGQWTFGVEVEDCGPRRLVKNNDLLFDLIRGCDLTRISDIGWRPWHRSGTPVPFSEFSDALGPKGSDKKEYVTNLFWVTFSGPVRKATLLPDCVSILVLSHENKDGWLEPVRVPVVRLATDEYQDSKDPDYVTGFRVVVDGAWLEDGVRGRETIFHDHTTWVEIEVRGDFIADCNGQAVDANVCGLIPAPTGKGTPGGTFLSTFAVEKPTTVYPVK